MKCSKLFSEQLYLRRLKYSTGGLPSLCQSVTVSIRKRNWLTGNIPTKSRSEHYVEIAKMWKEGEADK